MMYKIAGGSCNRIQLLLYACEKTKMETTVTSTMINSPHFLAKVVVTGHRCNGVGMPKGLIGLNQGLTQAREERAGTVSTIRCKLAVSRRREVSFGAGDQTIFTNH